MGFLSFLGPAVGAVGRVLGGVAGILGGGGGQQRQPEYSAVPPSTPPSGGETFVQKYMGWLIGGGAVLLGLIVWAVSGKKRGW